MLKRYAKLFETGLMLSDTLVVGLAFLAAYVIRFSFPENLTYETISDLRETRFVGCLVTILWPLIAYSGKLYVSYRAKPIWSYGMNILRTTVLTFLMVVTITYFVRDVRYSRLVLILWGALTVVGTSFLRVAFRYALQAMRKRGYNLRHFAIVGTGPLAQRVHRQLTERSEFGLCFAGFFELDKVATPDAPDGLLLGRVSDMARVIGEQGIEQVLIALPVEELPNAKPVMDRLSKLTVDVRLVPGFDELVTLCGSVEELAGLPMFNLQDSPLVGWNGIGKRLFDLMLVLVGFPLVMLVGGLVALCVKSTSHGPILYRQVRMGMDGRLFEMFKFRTMYCDAEKDGAQMARADDPRCTPIGKFLRRNSLDELPQLLNVIRGEMSLVGPRPERPCFIESFKSEIPRYALRHKTKAGMTGWAQINGFRGNTSIEERLDFDLYYIENWSLSFDFKILLKTVMGGYQSPHAY
ncbi:MAG: undecaprenyl-phosphate glucose phosphotransferase [Myxococcota bacterium]|nr:undecaprenyl-phosphate glucose phosphotransferase [Myxococcota bacterium]